MPKITALRGFPGAGKTSLAGRMVEPEKGERPSGPLVVSRDAIREMLVGPNILKDAPIKTYFDFGTEQMVTRMAQAQVREAVAADFDVVIDDTNLRQKYLVAWARLARELGADFDIDDVKVDSLEVLEVRNYERGYPLTPGRLRDLWARFPQDRWPSLETVLAAAEKPTGDRSWTPYCAPRPEDFPNRTLGERMWDVAYLVDIDGTLARNDGHRGWHDYAAVGGDKPIREIIRIVNALRNGSHPGQKIIFMSGRKDYCRDQTRRWLETHVGLWTAAAPLFMRADDDNRSDDIVKHELFHEHIQGRYHVEAVFDDRNRVVDMWRAIGLTCLQVAPGDF